MSDLLNKKITIESLEKSEGVTNGKPWTKYQVVDQDKNKYSFFTKKQDGEPTRAYADYTNLKLTLGSEIGVGYVEDQKKFTDKKGKERDYTQRTIRFFEEVLPEGVQMAKQSEPVIQVEEPPVEDEIQVDKIPF